MNLDQRTVGRWITTGGDRTVGLRLVAEKAHLDCFGAGDDVIVLENVAGLADEKAGSERPLDALARHGLFTEEPGEESRSTSCPWKRDLVVTATTAFETGATRGPSCQRADGNPASRAQGP